MGSKRWKTPTDTLVKAQRISRFVKAENHGQR